MDLLTRQTKRQKDSSAARVEALSSASGRLASLLETLAAKNKYKKRLGESLLESGLDSVVPLPCRERRTTVKGSPSLLPASQCGGWRGLCSSSSI